MDTVVRKVVRPTGAVARIGRTGRAEVTSATGARIELSSAVSTPGYSPVDLMYAGIAGCLAISLRSAASEAGVLDKLVSARIDVKGRKAPEGRSRITHFDIAVEIDGDFDDKTRHALIERAEELCTVSNTLRLSPHFVTTHP
jgi:uncharacterized OsmC-like protein